MMLAEQGPGWGAAPSQLWLPACPARTEQLQTGAGAPALDLMGGAGRGWGSCPLRPCMAHARLGLAHGLALLGGARPRDSVACQEDTKSGRPWGTCGPGPGVCAPHTHRVWPSRGHMLPGKTDIWASSPALGRSWRFRKVVSPPRALHGRQRTPPPPRHSRKEAWSRRPPASKRKGSLTLGNRLG